ncbi:hypothetical protein B0T22DRAFT_492325 [Podospora appendiculata]|uniref:Uncharacterized protein n=1 Tax=Podospora appendiculata TaxID=314037 RepID=A0AAE0X559_9PEZI|nr:hypothetical protein B0T22DRAFT_492325 [Podospora appendiculata]
MAQPAPRKLPASGHFTVANPEEGYVYTTSVPCNMMSYTDGEGVGHEIFLPAGQAGKAAAGYFANEQWAELAKYPKWEKQGYTDEFYVITKFKAGFPDGDEGVVVKEAGEALVLDERGEVVLPGRGGGESK